ncbi:hypothetical protein J2T15_002682 [Paenibacillus harenae]|uniref:Collagen-like protein n=1 Tax=Paenibacillus harenae TaxID=306543 RepID=A0ABT9U0U7_PAEHA|nr:hypothetical protein [Paenibacillus harenae]
MILMLALTYPAISTSSIGPPVILWEITSTSRVPRVIGTARTADPVLISPRLTVPVWGGDRSTPAPVGVNTLLVAGALHISALKVNIVAPKSCGVVLLKVTEIEVIVPSRGTAKAKFSRKPRLLPVRSMLPPVTGTSDLEVPKPTNPTELGLPSGALLEETDVPEAKGIIVSPPAVPAGPVGPGGPVGPVGPTAPAGPGGPIRPAVPAGPGGPGGPTVPAGPGRPGDPTIPAGPVGPGGPTVPAGPGGPEIPVSPGGPARPRRLKYLARSVFPLILWALRIPLVRYGLKERGTHTHIIFLYLLIVFFLARTHLVDLA